MTLRARLTLIYGVLLAIVFIAVGIGAKTFVDQKFQAQTRLTLTSTTQYIRNQYTFVPYNGPGQRYKPKPQLPPSRMGRLLKTPGLYFEFGLRSGRICRVCGHLGPWIHIDPAAYRDAVYNKHSSFAVSMLGKTQLETYYAPLVYTPGYPTADAVLVVAKSQADITGALNLLTIELFGGEALLWLIAVGVTWLVATSAVRPIGAMTDRAASIAETRDLSARVPVNRTAAELRRLAITFNLMLASLEEAYANQRRFVGDASHELRTPLTVIQGNLHYLESAWDAPEAERVDALHAARIEADRMGLLVADLLALSQADAGHELHQEPVELDRVVVEACRRLMSSERGAFTDRSRVRLRLGRLDEFVVQGDYYRLLQLALILLDNGLKYTPPGGEVVVELNALAPDRCTICVADNGVGIAAEDRDRIFERFHRGRSTRGMSEGSGLGLAIARWIAESHGGSIDFRDNPGGGTIFVVDLPGRAPAQFGLTPPAVAKVDHDALPDAASEPSPDGDASSPERPAETGAVREK